MGQEKTDTLEWPLYCEAANFLKHADRDPDAWLLDNDPRGHLRLS
jgi:hypothetical protein